MAIRRPLGRGLEALIPSHAESADATTPDIPAEGSAAPAQPALTMVATERIQPGRLQPRQYFDEGALAELAAAIKAQGVIEPLIVRRMGDGFELIAGERRLRAARLAGLTSVPVVVRDDLDDRAALEVSLVENLLRENLSVIEEGQAFARLNREFGLTHEMIATRLGKSRSYVTNVIRMLELPDEVRAMIQRGELTAGQTRPLLALDSAAAQVAGARRIAAEGLPARAAERLAAEHKAGARGGAEGQAAARNPFLAALTESLQRALHRKVRIVRGRGAGPGYIELEFYDDEDLTALARMLAAAGE